MNQKRTYIAALGHPSGLVFHDYDSISFDVASDADAVAKATEWLNQPERVVDPGAWLVVKDQADGRCIHSKQLGWTNAGRPRPF